MVGPHAGQSGWRGRVRADCVHTTANEAKSGDGRSRPRGRRNWRIALVVLAIIVALIGLSQLTPPEQSSPESVNADLTPRATPLPESPPPVADTAGSRTGNAGESSLSSAGSDAATCDIKQARYLEAGGYPATNMRILSFNGPCSG
ncbi:hypothetical protein NITHO_940013 [Nitrolancea hollandica Lb]|uniref:Uncharacterized protein n=1 Tax=Nitrolancea hollandica Lb TaxID=1129897 RepID=I4ENJ2_9BACT|nr:hypothetical protein NITHO_940013 [Nitrolancea hollandica Lb]